MPSRQKVVVLRQIPEVALKDLARSYDVEINLSGQVLGREQLYRRVKNAAAIISLLTDRIDEPVLQAAGPNLKIVANYAVGFDNLDLAALKAHKVAATNTPGQLTESVAEHSLALLLAVARRVVEGDGYVREGKYKQWEPLIFYGQTLMDRTIGIVGGGRIGTGLAVIAHNGLRMRVVYCDLEINHRLEREVGAKKVSLRTLLKQSDVVSLHVPLLPTTKHLISGREMLLMKRSAILINTSRGPVIDEVALVKFLEEKRIFGAGLDVFENEPKLTPGLKCLANVVLTPHIGSATKEAREQMAMIAAANIRAVLSGRPPLNPVS